MLRAEAAFLMHLVRVASVTEWPSAIVAVGADHPLHSHWSSAKNGIGTHDR